MAPQSAPAPDGMAGNGGQGAVRAVHKIFRILKL